MPSSSWRSHTGDAINFKPVSGGTRDLETNRTDITIEGRKEVKNNELTVGGFTVTYCSAPFRPIRTRLFVIVSSLGSAVIGIHRPALDPHTAVGTMAHYDIFRHHLSIKFPAYGHALWDPNPGNLYPAVEVGDVGYIRKGKFHRLFNVLLPADHPSHHDFGVPEYHEQLTLNIENHIDIGSLDSHNFYSTGVTLGPESDPWADGPKKEGEVTFSCPRNQGAVLCLPIQTKREDTVANTKFGKWIIKHIGCWFAWARQLELGVDRMEDIILVTGTHRTRSCTNIAFLGGQEDAQVSFRAKVDRRDDVVTINWQFSRERDRGAVLNCGRDGEDLPEDQCIFIRGFRVTRKLRILPLRLKGEAGPNPDPEGYDDSEESDMVLKPIPSIPEYRDPLHMILEYISEKAPPDCDVLLVHDDDLAQLGRIYDSTPLNALEPDVMLSHVRSLKPTIHNTRIDLPSARNSASAGTESAWVATLSSIFEEQCPSSTSSASQSLHVNTTSIRHIPKGRGGGDPVRNLNNYLQGHPTGNLTPQFSWEMKQYHMATYYAAAKFRGVEIGHGSGPSMAMAKSVAALQALQHLKTFGI